MSPCGVYVKRAFRWYEVLSRPMPWVVREFSPEGNPNPSTSSSSAPCRPGAVAPGDGAGDARPRPARGRRARHRARRRDADAGQALRGAGASGQRRRGVAAGAHAGHWGDRHRLAAGGDARDTSWPWRESRPAPTATRRRGWRRRGNSWRR